MSARIYRPAKTATSSGKARTDAWVLEFASDNAKDIDPLMGWTSSGDTQSQVVLSFDTKEEALAFAAAKGLEPTVVDPQPRAFNVRPGGYGENFATSRRGPWTH
jgi:hypothetical protein